jgi:hypothetical protein
MIRQRWLAIVALVLAVVAVGAGIDRALFVARAQKTAGNVVAVSATNDRCGSRRRSRYECTKFSAAVEFATSRGATATHHMYAGSSRGHDGPVSKATVHPGDVVPIVYDPKDPERSYEDRTQAIWGFPGGSALLAALMFLMSLTDRRR